MMGRRIPNGFTLIELVVTVTVLAVLAGLAAPSFIDFMHRNQVASQSNEFLGTLRLARTTAITRSVFVSICPTLDAAADEPECAVSSDYATGYLVYTSTAPDKAFTAGDELIKVSQATPAVSLRAPSANKILTFSPRGASTAGTLSLLLCARRGSEDIGESTLRVSGRRFDIQASGRAGLVELPTSASSDAAAGYCTPAS